MNLLTTEEVKQYLKINSDTTMYKLLKLSTFPKIKIGKTYRIPQDKLDKWIGDNIGKSILL